MAEQLTDRVLFVISLGLLSFSHIYLPIISAASVGTFSVPASNEYTDKVGKVERLKIAAEIIKYRDESIDPCENFYGFVCGNYQATDVSNDEKYLENKRTEYLDALIEQVSSSDFKPFKLMTDFQKTCMDESARGTKDLDLLKSIIERLGGWPVVKGDAWKESEFDWINTIGSAKQFGYTANHLLDWEAGAEGGKLKYSVKMPKSYFDSSIDNLTAIKKRVYVDYMVKMAQLLGASMQDAQSSSEAVFEFEEKLSEINSESGSVSENISVEELQKQWPSVDWSNFVEKTLVPFLDPDEKPILAVWNENALTKFVELMKKTPKRVQANYEIWKIVQYSIPYLTDEFEEVHDLFENGVGYAKMPRKAKCLEMLKQNTEYAMYYLYLDHYKSSQETVKSMVESIENVMIEMIKESKALLDEDKNEGIQRLRNTQVIIGPFKESFDPKELEEFYEHVQVDKNNFLQTLLNFNNFKLKKDFSSKDQSKMIPFNLRRTSGLRIYSSNHLYIPAEMIPNNVFNNDYPMYMNYGSLGSHIAMKMIYGGPDPEIESEQELKDKTACFQQNHDNDTDIAYETAGARKLVEKYIEMYMGFRIARAAYSNFAAQTPEASLPELSYSPNQLFWISYVKSMCFADMEFTKLRTFHNNQLSAGENLLMDMLSIIPEISADFQCPVGSYMNRPKQCTWW